MADFEHWQLEIWLEFVHRSFDRHNNFSEGSSERKPMSFQLILIIPESNVAIVLTTF